MAARVSITAIGLTDPGKLRENNEDAFLVSDLTRAGARTRPGVLDTFDASTGPVLLCVSDGMGGAASGEVASALVIDSLNQALMGTRGDWEAATLKAVETANRAVWVASQTEGRAGMGATLTAVCIEGSIAYIAEVGDSRAYLLRRGLLQQLTRDQSYLQLMVEAGTLPPAEADSNDAPMKSMVLQMMGQKGGLRWPGAA